MPEPHQDSRSAIKSNCAAMIMAALVLVGPAPAIAQSICTGVELPAREAAKERQLAVWDGSEWQFVDESKVGGLPHPLGQRNTEICLAWGAPPYRESARQIVYVSTRFATDQSLSLFRNSSLAGLPFFQRFGRDWEPSSLGGADHNAFRNFHDGEGRPGGTISARYFTRWHDTAAWRANDPSYNFVSAAVGRLDALPHGAERLLTLAANRPFMSWVPFGTHPPRGEDELRIAVVYSGDLGLGSGVRVHEYNFAVRE